MYMKSMTQLEKSISPVLAPFRGAKSELQKRTYLFVKDLVTIYPVCLQFQDILQKIHIQVTLIHLVSHPLYQGYRKAHLQ